jgi:hypothetical protein
MALFPVPSVDCSEQPSTGTTGILSWRKACKRPLPALSDCSQGEVFPETLPSTETLHAHRPFSATEQPMCMRTSYKGCACMYRMGL